MRVFVVRHTYPWSEGDDMVQVFDSFEAVAKKLEMANILKWDTGESIKIECVDVLDAATMEERLNNVRSSRSN